MSRPRLLDLFCGAGGAATGYHRAGFDVVGVDINPQPHYPFEFHQGDAMTWPLDGFDAIHASPPCQAYSITKHSHNVKHPDLLPSTLDRLQASGQTWVVENVPGAPLPDAITLCASSFGLMAWDESINEMLWLRRHRLFASSVAIMSSPCAHPKGMQVGGVYGGGSVDRSHAKFVRRGGYTPPNGVRRDLMGIDWMTGNELSQAIPPAYTEWIGAQLIGSLR